MAIIGLLGFIGSGKGTTANTLIQEHHFREDSFAASVKDALSVIFNWPRELLEGKTDESRLWRNQVDTWWSEKLNIPNFTPRYAMQHFGTDIMRNCFHTDIWLFTVENRMSKGGNVVVSDARFPNEVAFLQQMGAKIIRVKGNNDPVWVEIATRATSGDEDALREMNECFPEVHISEWAWLGTTPDYVIYNNGTIDDLQNKVKNALGGKLHTK